MTRHRGLIALFLLGCGVVAAWATNDTIGVTAGSGKIANLIKFVSNNVMSEVGICDATTENQCATVNGSGNLLVYDNQPQVGGTNMIGYVGLQANTTGGCTPGVILTAASNNATQIGAAGTRTLCELSFLNTTTGVFSVRLYDTGSAPAAGAPCNSATGVAANYVAQSNAISPGFTINLGPFGKAFTAGLVVCITGANANNDNTNAATGGNLNYAYK